jgi:SAM-dependent methyltransferase
MDDFDQYARFYDLDAGTFADDLPMWEHFALRTGSPLLDLACGTGRLLIPLARQGYQITGIDVSGAMLDLAREKLAVEGLEDRARLVQQDMRHLHLGHRFRLALCALSSFAHVLAQEEQVEVLRRVRDHLVPGGLLVLDMFNPDLPGMLSSEGQVVLHKTWSDLGTGRRVLKFVARQVDWATQIQRVTFILDEIDDAGGVSRSVFPFGMRFLFRAEAELLVRAAGLELEAVYGSYDLDEYAEDSPVLILVARRPMDEASS